MGLQAIVITAQMDNTNIFQHKIAEVHALTNTMKMMIDVFVRNVMKVVSTVMDLLPKTALNVPNPVHYNIFY